MITLEKGNGAATPFRCVNEISDRSSDKGKPLFIYTLKYLIVLPFNKRGVQ